MSALLREGLLLRPARVARARPAAARVRPRTSDRLLRPHPGTPAPVPRCPLQKEVALLGKLQAELAHIDARQGELKKALYAKFGNQINLED